MSGQSLIASGRVPKTKRTVGAWDTRNNVRITGEISHMKPEVLGEREGVRLENETSHAARTPYLGHLGSAGQLACAGGGRHAHWRKPFSWRFV